jgi:hypothetical protein
MVGVPRSTGMTNPVSKLMTLLVLASIALGTGCVVRSTPSRTVYRSSATVHDHRR